jgi:hypothetical protein
MLTIDACDLVTQRTFPPASFKGWTILSVITKGTFLILENLILSNWRSYKEYFLPNCDQDGYLLKRLKGTFPALGFFYSNFLASAFYSFSIFVRSRQIFFAMFIPRFSPYDEDTLVVG